VGVAFHRRGDIVETKDEVVDLFDGLRSPYAIDQAKQCHHVAGAGLCDRVVQKGERADMNHAVIPAICS
jgi:hypothetical protein